MLNGCVVRNKIIGGYNCLKHMQSSTQKNLDLFEKLDLDLPGCGNS